MSEGGARRFYKLVTVDAQQAGWAIQLDGRTLKTPAKQALYLPTEGLAKAVAEEWSAQSERVDPRSMPLMQLSATAIDRVHPNRDQVIEETAAYGCTDLVCYRAAGPADLVHRQEVAWQPLVGWVQARYDLSLCVTSGIQAIDQPAHATETFRRILGAFDTFGLTALATLTATAGSLVIALAVSERELTPEQATEAALLDELYQAEKWGADPEAVRRRQSIAEEIAQAARFLTLSRARSET